MPWTYDHYRQILQGERLPLAYVDLDLLFKNCQTLLAAARGLPIRLASKSIRSTRLLQLVLNHNPGFRGVMAYSAKEAAFLSSQSIDDILIAYPSVERQDLRQACAEVKKGANITFTIDAIEQAAVLAEVAKECQVQASICLDLDMSVALPGVFFGVKRSPLRTPQAIAVLGQNLRQYPNLTVRGLMGYEAQMAGVPDRHPQKRLESFVASLLKQFTFQHVKKRRAQAVQALREIGFDIDLVNGGGTGSLTASRQDQCLTELAAGSGLYAPRLFDFYDHLNLQPAAGFVLPVTRRPDAQTATCHGGGYSASGAAGKDRLPIPYLPVGLKLLHREGAGEVQTPLRGAVSGLQIGDPVFFRHAKAGELCEHFNELICIQDHKIVDRVLTYRGERQSF